MEPWNNNATKNNQASSSNATRSGNFPHVAAATLAPAPPRQAIPPLAPGANDVFVSGETVTEDQIHEMVKELLQMEDDQMAAAASSSSAAANPNAAGGVVVHRARSNVPQYNYGDVLRNFLSNAGFVTYDPAELSCIGCTVTREIRHLSDLLSIYFRLHGHEPGIIGHAVVTITRRPAQGQAPAAQHLYMGMMHCTRDWIETLVGIFMQTLRCYPHGQTRDIVLSFPIAGTAAFHSNPPLPPLQSTAVIPSRYMPSPNPAERFQYQLGAPQAIPSVPLPLPPPPSPAVYAHSMNTAAVVTANTGRSAPVSDGSRLFPAHRH